MTTTAKVDIIAGGNAQGEIANLLKINGKIDVNARRPYLDSKGVPRITVFKGGDPKDVKNYSSVQVNAAVLRRDEWIQLDEAVLQVARERLGGFDYFINKGLVKNLTNAMGTTVLEWHTISDSQEAIVSMDGLTRGQGDRSNYKHHFLPIPIIHNDYEINARELAVSRNMGTGMDTSEAEHAVRKILEKQEDMLFTNYKFSWGNKDTDGRNTIWSLLNYPDRNTETLTKAWDDPTITPADILADVVKLKNKNLAAKFYGPYTLFIPTAYDAILDEDYDVSGSSLMTIRERILKLANVQEIVVVDRLLPNNILLVQTTPNVIRIINGLPIQNIEWSNEGGMVFKYKTLTIRVPQLRSDYNKKTGIAHMA